MITCLSESKHSWNTSIDYRPGHVSKSGCRTGCVSAASSCSPSTFNRSDSKRGFLRSSRILAERRPQSISDWLLGPTGALLARTALFLSVLLRLCSTSLQADQQSKVVVLIIVIVPVYHVQNAENPFSAQSICFQASLSFPPKPSLKVLSFSSFFLIAPPLLGRHRSG